MYSKFSGNIFLLKLDIIQGNKDTVSYSFLLNLELKKYIFFTSKSLNLT